MSGIQDEYLVIGPRSFGKAIREFRLRHHVSQQQLAELTEIHRSYISELESGSTTEALRRIMRAIAALDLEVVVRERGIR